VSEFKRGGETSCPWLAIGQQVKVVCPRHGYDGKRGSIIGFSGIKEGEAVYEVQIEGEAIAAGLRRSSLVKVEAACGDIQVGDKVWVQCEVKETTHHSVRICFDGVNWFWAGRQDCRPVEPSAIEACTETANDQLLQSLKDYPFGEPSDSPEIPAMGVEVVSDLGSQVVKPPTKEPTQAQKLAERTMKAIWAANDAVDETSVIKDCLTTESNSPEILDGSSEPMRDAFEADMVKRYGYERASFARNEDRYFDSSVEIAWQAYRAGAKYQPSPLAPSPCTDGVNADRFVDGAMEARGRTSDPINPSHYKQGGIECIEAIKAATGDGFIGYVWGNVLKYLWRWPKKGGVDDLKKARWYLDRLINEVGE
jgi:hypothetical protein